MKNFILRISCFFLVICCVHTAMATHLLGGRISYSLVSGCTYQVQLEGYYDCAGLAPSSTAIVDAYNPCTGITQSLTLTQTNSEDITPYCGTGGTICTNPNSTIPGIKRVLYTGTYTVCGGTTCNRVVFDYSDCCRSGNIVNLNNGTIYETYIYSDTLNHNLTGPNDSYRFRNNGVVYLCSGSNMNVSLATSGADSTYYQLAACQPSAWQTIPYNVGYTPTSPLGAGYTFSLNNNTGYLSLTANSPSTAVGFYMVGVNIYTYQNGVSKGHVHQEIPVMVTNCSAAQFNPNHADFTMTYNGLNNTIDCGYVGPLSNPAGIIWDYGTATGPTYNFATPTSGTYGAMLKTDNGASCIDSMYRKMYVTATNPNPLVVNNINVMTISNNSFSFSANVTGGTTPYAYNWDFGDGSATVTSATPTHSYTAPGTYNVCVYVTDAMGATASSCMAVSVVCPSNSIVANPSGTVTAGTSVTFSLANAVAGAATYYWTPSFVTTASMAMTLSTPGANPISVTVTNSTGLACTYNTSVNVQSANPCSSVASNYTYTGNTYNLPATLNFNNLSTPGTGCNYIWDFGDGTTSTNVSPTHTYSTQGIYNVCLITQLLGTTCKDTMCQSIGINIGVDANGYIYANSAVSDSFKVYLIRYTAFGGGSLTAIDSQKVAGAPAYYSFLNLNPADSLYTKAMMLPNSPNYANYLPTYHDSTLFWANALQLNFMTMPPLPPSFDIYMKAGTNPGGPGFIGGLISQGANKTGGAGVGNVSVLLLHTDYSGVTHTVTNQNGEYSFSNLDYGTYLVYPEMLNKTTIPLTVTISPNAVTVTDQNMLIQHDSIYVDNTVAITPSIFQSLQVFPNPTSKKLTVNMKVANPTDVTLSLIDVMGRTLVEKRLSKIEEESYELNMMNYSNGIYYLKIATPNQGQVIEKIVKE